MKTIRTIAALMLLALAMTACEDEPVTPAPPAKQPVSLTGTAWGIDNGGSYHHSTIILRFLTDSTGTQYIFIKQNGEIFLDTLRPIGYQFDSLTHEGRFYPAGLPSFFYRFSYNAADTTLTYHDASGDILLTPLADTTQSTPPQQ